MPTATSLVTTTRPSTAAYFDGSGVLQLAAPNILRLDHDPATAAARGALFEDTAANLAWWSEDFSNVYWNKTAVSASAGELIEDTTTPAFRGIASPNIAVAKNVLQSFSVDLKSMNRNARLQLNAYGGNNIIANFDLAAGTFLSSSSGGTATGGTGIIRALDDGWYRVSVIGIPKADDATTGAQASVFPMNGGAITYTGDGVSSLKIRRSQIETGYPSSYIKTEAAAATRAADICDMPVDAFGLNPLEGTIMVEAMARSIGTTGGIVCPLSDNNNYINLTMSAGGGGGLGFYAMVGGVNQLSGNFYSGVVTPFVPFKAAIAYKKNDYAWKVTGNPLGTDASADIPPFTTLRIGRRDAAATFWNGWISQVRYVPRRMTNDEINAWVGI